MPDFSDNQTHILTVGVAALVLLIAVIVVAKRLAEPLHRLADAKEEEGKARADDLEKLVEALRKEFGGQIRRLEREFYGFAEETHGTFANLQNDVAALGGYPAPEEVPTAGGYSAESPTAVYPAAEAPRAGGYPHPEAATEVQPAVAAHEPGEYTRAIMSASATTTFNLPTRLPEPTNTRAIWELMTSILEQEAPGAHPWTMHPTMEVDGQRYNWYDVIRAAMMKDQPGYMLPRNMHDLWTGLASAKIWKDNGPTEAEMTETSRPLIQPPTQS